MVIQKGAVAGTMESSDVMITVRPQGEGIEISLKSTVEAYFGERIAEVIREELARMGVTAARVEAVDHGALDCTIRARVTTAVRRAGREEG
ncbi:MAG: citrate lyase acyl carrier protein [Clostridium sp.]|nr:citrate lyase acyl carrier protein [Clostridium sp.]